MSHQEAEALGRSLTTFGDLSSVVFNANLQKLVGGHMRLERMKELPGERRVVINERAGEGTYAGLEYLDDVGTVAVGYIWIGNRQWPYREVSWDEGKHYAANIAANKISGEFDQELLGQITYELSQLDNGDELLALTGFDDKELQKILADVGVEPFGESQPDELGADPHDDDNRRISATNEQWSTIDEAVGYVKARVPIPSEDNGAKYGSSLYYICRVFLEGIHAAEEQAESQNTTPPGELTDIPE